MGDILEMKGITKIFFGGVTANEGINFTLRKGEVHSILGENGAGKSTLMNILSGVLHPTAGEIFLNNEKVVFESAKDAIYKGIGMVYQHFMLVPRLTVAENIILGIRRDREPLLQIKKAAEEITAFAGQYGMEIDPFVPVWQLSVGQEQRVEIIKVLFRGAKILILDEPTAVLTLKETEELFKMIRTFIEQDFSVVFISHKIDEVIRISDRISILRRSRLVETLDNRELSKKKLARLMVGRDVSFSIDKKACCAGDAVLTLEHVYAKNNKGLEALKDVSITVREGEILGIAGVDGNGQSELLEVITGLRRVVEGRITLNREDIAGKDPRSILEMGLAHIPEDRHARGLVLDLNIKENFISNDYYIPPHSKRNWINWPFIRKHTRENVKRFDVRTSSIDVPVSGLSGGNQQKLILARELHSEPVIIAAMHAARGLDVGAVEYIHKRIIEARDRGTAILYISTELEELINISDRLAVMCRGEIMGVVDPRVATIEEIGLMMAGYKHEQTAGQQR